MLKLLVVCALVVICSVSPNSALQECKIDSDCALPTQKCRVGRCLTKGCRQFCDMMYRPVCGTDGKTYGSECRLESEACNTQNAGLAVASQGKCAVTTSPPELTTLELTDQPTGHPTNQPTGPPGSCSRTPCLNGGKCLDRYGELPDYICYCPLYYYGQNCQYNGWRLTPIQIQALMTYLFPMNMKK